MSAEACIVDVHYSDVYVEIFKFIYINILQCTPSEYECESAFGNISVGHVCIRV